MKNRTKQLAVDKLLELMIENVLSVLNILNADLQYKMPADENDLISIFEEKKILPRKLCEKIRLMKGFRNVLVHRYDTFDKKRVFDFLDKCLKDFSVFEKAIVFFINKK